MLHNIGYPVGHVIVSLCVGRIGISIVKLDLLVHLKEIGLASHFLFGREIFRMFKLKYNPLINKLRPILYLEQ